MRTIPKKTLSVSKKKYRFSIKREKINETPKNKIPTKNRATMAL